jgi:3-hydroxyacyl-CoA dehydrogenase/enoyl-CoA hydratase/3-hydroxybutyryl-CoA epimerase
MASPASVEEVPVGWLVFDVESVVDANIGSIFGIGFAPWTGGAIQFLNQYGIQKAVARAKELEAKYGERFAVPALLQEKADKNETFK